MNKYIINFKNEEVFEEYFYESKDQNINNKLEISYINLLIGANNSGKTRFMRKLMSSSFKTINKTLIEDINKKIKLLNNSNNNANKLRVLTYDNINSLENIILSNERIINSFRAFDGNFYDFYQDNINKIIEDLLGTKKYFIPTLRTAHSLYIYRKKESQNQLLKIEEDFFLETIHKNYPEIKSSKIIIFTGINLYKNILNARNSRKDERKKFEDFELFLGDNFFGGKKIDVVAEFNKDENQKNDTSGEIISIYLDDQEKEEKLYELGDGIQALIILMYQIFMADENSLIFIDEPELNLHPGMQRLFIEQITNNEVLKLKKLIYFISTHSNHFLDLTIEKEATSIFSFNAITENKEKKIKIKNLYSGNREILNNLGVNNSSVFMANCSIWVEGISDRFYIKSFLKSYLIFLKENKPEKYQNIKEDIDFTFFEYAGSNITHYLFDQNQDNIEENEEYYKEFKKSINAFSLNNKIFLLADSDCADKRGEKGKRLLNLERLESKNFHPNILWGIREIENILPNEVWKKLLINFTNNSLIDEHRVEIEDKIKNALVKIDYNEYKKEYIGEFLNLIRSDVGKIKGKFIINESNYEVKKGGDGFGTLKNKRSFSELLYEENFEWEILSQNKEIKNLTEKVYDFIISSKK